MIIILTILLALTSFSLGYAVRCWQEDRVLNQWHTKLISTWPVPGSTGEQVISLEL
jgi:hypothetical protein